MVIRWFYLLNNNYNFANSHNWASTHGIFEHEIGIRFCAEFFPLSRQITVKLWARCNEDRIADIMMKIISGNLSARRNLLICLEFVWLLQPENQSLTYIVSKSNIDNVSADVFAEFRLELEPPVKSPILHIASNQYYSLQSWKKTLTNIDDSKFPAYATTHQRI